MTDTPNRTALARLPCDTEPAEADRQCETDARPPGDMWRVDVAGYPCSVRGEAAKDHLESVNRKLARMKLALHKLAWRDDDAGRVARLALEIDSAALRRAPPAELCPGLMAAAEWHESRLPFWDALIEKHWAAGNLVAERGACAYRNSHSSSASILRGKATGEIGL